MRKKFLFSTFLFAGCADRPMTSDCDEMCQPASPALPGIGECVNGACTPTYVGCTTKEQVSTCTEAREARGSICATNGCGGYTYQIFSILEWCENPENVGVEVEHDCDAPIDWQVNDAVRCCCEQEN